ncbi:uncharacterized protein YjiS (DUF1127 family) [Ectopseudomonas oleovorans]|uniref:Uncharacterized protein YjiS (DUF1127 family) n=1 Tax=Ectopseudomonas oleovorans TaxID=301 RepID=A0A397M8S3_ECTOL|nr:DUF1127 domain-containing protein [Pseudomonas oleovorans]RIA19247.1 uncharacterized protein YjiS (DUF1127 family) [Pseudomonas oleovorans]
MERTREQHPEIIQPTGLDWLGLYSKVRLWYRNLRTRRQLARLDARQLADAGISNAQRSEELDKPFWR